MTQVDNFSTSGAAKLLSDEVNAIVDGGFLDPLDDASLVEMARRIDPAVTREDFDECADRFFRLRFADGSDIVFDRMDGPLQELCDEYGAWLAANDMPSMSADELLAELNAETRRSTEEQRRWLSQFIMRWEKAERDD